MAETSVRVTLTLKAPAVKLFSVTVNVIPDPSEELTLFTVTALVTGVRVGVGVGEKTLVGVGGKVEVAVGVNEAVGVGVVATDSTLTPE